MNKDALLATLIGFGIGLSITGAFLFGPNLLKSFPSLSFKLPSLGNFRNQPDTVTPIPTPQSQPTSLTVSAPLDGSIESTDEALVSGTAPSGSIVVISGLRDDIVVTANEAGTFGGKVTLAEGENTIVVTSYIGDKEESTTLTVYYTAEKL